MAAAWGVPPSYYLPLTGLQKYCIDEAAALLLQWEREKEEGTENELAL